jgi:hypothetical protein
VNTRQTEELVRAVVNCGLCEIAIALEKLSYDLPLKI